MVGDTCWAIGGLGLGLRLCVEIAPLNQLPTPIKQSLLHILSGSVLMLAWLTSKSVEDRLPRSFAESAGNVVTFVGDNLLYVYDFYSKAVKDCRLLS